MVLRGQKVEEGPSWRWRRARPLLCFRRGDGDVDTVTVGTTGTCGLGRRWTGPPVGWSGLPPPHDFLFQFSFSFFL